MPETDVGFRHFACTQCGNCCNRSPEVELSEAAGLADVFVFQLLFRLYSQARAPEQDERGGVPAFYEKKRLMNAHSARVYRTKESLHGKTLERTNYLMISALALDTRRGACSALSSAQCSIHPRRPLTCQTVPFHYSRPLTLASRDLDAFVATEGYRCDISAAAPVVLSSGRIVDEPMLEARAAASRVAQRDRPWKEAIVAAMKRSGNAALPSLREIEANATIGALTTSMRIGWEVASAAALMTDADVRTLVSIQLQTIECALEKRDVAAEARGTLEEMKIEYRAALNR